MSEDQNSLDNDGLPDNFWRVPNSFIEDDALRLLHAEVCVRLRNENSDADTLELMAIERVASLYIWMRNKENNSGFNSDTAYKDMIKLWTAMAADLRKTRIAVLDNAEAQAQIMTMLVGAINDALAGVEPEIANTVKRRIMEAVS